MGCPKKAAVPHDPATGPIWDPSIAFRYAGGSFGPAPWWRVVPSSSRIDVTVSDSAVDFDRQEIAVEHPFQRLALGEIARHQLLAEAQQVA